MKTRDWILLAVVGAVLLYFLARKRSAASTLAPGQTASNLQGLDLLFTSPANDAEYAGQGNPNPFSAVGLSTANLTAPLNAFLSPTASLAQGQLSSLTGASPSGINASAPASFSSPSYAFSGTTPTPTNTGLRLSFPTTTQPVSRPLI